MSWAIGSSSKWNRDVGYGVPAYCDHPNCTEEIDRGLAYICCGQEIDGGDDGCGLFFCEKHRGHGGKCERCAMLPDEDDKKDFEWTDDQYQAVVEWATRVWPGDFEAKSDHPRWMYHKVHHHSWAEWRADNPEEVAKLRETLGSYTPPADDHDTQESDPSTAVSLPGDRQ